MVDSSIKTLHLNTKATYGNKQKTLKYTLPSLSTKLFNLISTKLSTNKYTPIYTPYPIYTPPTKNILIRQIKTKRINSYDINSLYPFSLINRLPSNKSNRYNKHKKLNYLIAQITPPNFELIPFEYHNTNKYTPIYTHTHLNYLKKLGYTITKKHTINICYSTQNSIDSILHLYKTKNTKYNPITKLLLNSYYGKILIKEQSKSTFNKFSITIPTMLTYSKITVHQQKNKRNNPPCYSDTDSFHTRHNICQDKKKNIGLLKHNLLDQLNITSPRNYIYKTNNRSFTWYKGHTYTPIYTLPKNLISLIKVFII